MAPRATSRVHSINDISALSTKIDVILVAMKTWERGASLSCNGESILDVVTTKGTTLSQTPIIRVGGIMPTSPTATIGQFNLHIWIILF